MTPCESVPRRLAQISTLAHSAASLSPTPAAARNAVANVCRSALPTLIVSLLIGCLYAARYEFVLCEVLATCTARSLPRLRGGLGRGLAQAPRSKICPLPIPPIARRRRA